MGRQFCPLVLLALGFALFYVAGAEGAIAQRPLFIRRLLAVGTFGTESSLASGKCEVKGPCLPCTATEKATEAVCDQSGYRQEVECPAGDGTNASFNNQTTMDPTKRGLGEGSSEKGTVRDAGAGKKLLQSGDSGSGGAGFMTFQVCWPEGEKEGLTVLGFETIVALVLTVAAPVMVYRRRKAGSNASSQGMQRIPSNSRF